MFSSPSSFLCLWLTVIIEVDSAVTGGRVSHLKKIDEAFNVMSSSTDYFQAQEREFSFYVMLFSYITFGNIKCGW